MLSSRDCAEVAEETVVEAANLASAAWTAAVRTPAAASAFTCANLWADASVLTPALPLLIKGKLHPSNNPCWKSPSKVWRPDAPAKSLCGSSSTPRNRNRDDPFEDGVVALGLLDAVAVALTTTAEGVGLEVIETDADGEGEGVPRN